MYFIYKFLTTISLPLYIMIVFLRKYLKKEDDLRFKEKFLSNYFFLKSKNELFWFHAASIGEFKSIVPIIKNLQLKKPEADLSLALPGGVTSSSEIQMVDEQIIEVLSDGKIIFNARIFLPENKQDLIGKQYIDQLNHNMSAGDQTTYERVTQVGSGGAVERTSETDFIF